MMSTDGGKLQSSVCRTKEGDEGEDKQDQLRSGRERVFGDRFEELPASSRRVQTQFHSLHTLSERTKSKSSGLLLTAVE